ncbi:MAG: bifunctional oligoribonuclease/PAP phosphatase NrnA [Erysipelotrichaceae bacterium]|nr:bifunctional oligoribonuclease/PAP phosphatase NrnA [Erysipelotrichaceae bacterium]
MYKEVLDQLLKYDKISIFRHQRPDGDCMFSALALESFIKDNFPDKTVKIAGEDIYDLVSRNDKLSDRYIKESLAFIVDTSNETRIDDQRAMKARFKIKMDHHPLLENYGDINIIEPKTSACCELIAKILFSKDFKGYEISRKTCEYLYCGIISDTINFRTTNVTTDTFSIASKLVKVGDLQISELVEFVMDKSLDSFQKAAKIVSKLKLRGSFGYIFLKLSDLEKIGVSQIEAKNNIDEIGKIKELNIWSVAIETKDKLIDCSVRSKKGFIVNQLCARYGGGGHANAAAVKNLSKKDFKRFYEELDNMANQN